MRMDKMVKMAQEIPVSTFFLSRDKIIVLKIVGGVVCSTLQFVTICQRKGKRYD